MSSEGAATDLPNARAAPAAAPAEASVEVLVEAPARPITRVESTGAVIRSLRPHQWIKNAFVAAPLVFAQKLGDPSYVARTALAVLAFCALSGAVYMFNDVLDFEADRQHPTKRHRPIAAGLVSRRAALAWSALIAAGALAACAALDWRLAALAAAYLTQNAAYTLRLKRVAFVDVALIASGFLLRVLAGSAAIAVPTSGWLLLCTALLALFLGFGKRAHELAWATRSGWTTQTRAALAGYRHDILWAAMLALALATCVTFVAYTLDAHTVAEFGTSRLIYSAPFVAFGLLRFLSLALWWPRDEPPTEAMLKDPWFLIDLVAAVATVLYVIYG
jgi:decaprenyl-phosphate phosphoribosyltransferase